MAPKKKNNKSNTNNIFRIFKNGDFRTRLSYLIMGFGNISRGQIVKGLLYFALEPLFIYFITNPAWKYLHKFNTLGTATRIKVWDEAKGIYTYQQGDNSVLILLFSVFSIAIAIGFILLYVSNIKSAYKAQQLREKRKKLPNIIEDIKDLFDGKYHITLLSFPTLAVLCFTILPIIFMILMAFTNFDSSHQPPGHLFTWIGLDNFKNILYKNTFWAKTLWRIFGWTLVWAVFATFTCYIFGMILAIIINKKGIKLKPMWRTIFVISMAVPQFVSLLLIRQMLQPQGAFNVLLKEWGWISTNIKFFADADLARVMVIVINMWVGIPATMLMTTGILMNIPAELYESAKIDGAGPFKTFCKITLPYMLFVTTPYLITAFIGNINNFNVIFLLTRGEPKTLDYFQAGKTDLLVTWLYKLTVDKQDYNLASVIGIFVFIVTASFSLIVYNMSASTRKEDQFQ